MNPGIIIGGGALLLLALAGGKKKHKPIPPPEPLPEPNGGGDGGDGEPAPTPENQQVLAVLEDYVMPDGYEFPQDVTTEEWPATMWVSEDCKAYAVGKQFRPLITDDIVEFYNSVVDTVAEDDAELASSPPDHWDEILFDAGETPFESPTKRWAMQYLFDFDGGVYEMCAAKLPVVQDYPSWDAYLQAFADFSAQEPALYRLFYRHLYQPAMQVMDAAWRERFPLEAQMWHEREWAYKALDQNLNLEDRTDWAFHHAYADGPEVLDPNDPGHQDYIQAWIRLRDMIKEFS